MSIIGREIIQSRLWIDPNETPVPNLNYKEVFPITTFDAVREDINREDSTTLREVLDDHNDRINSKQPIIPGHPANYLITHGGIPGHTGSILMSKTIPWLPEDQSHSRIPTEKAVGDLLFRLGLVDSDGNGIPDQEIKINWSSILGRPKLYSSISLDDDGVPTQRLFVETTNDINDRITTLKEDHEALININLDLINNHKTNYNNPHGVTAEQVGAPSVESLNLHVNDYDNPHQTTATQIGLSNVNNTSDSNKPISIATQAALDLLNAAINEAISDYESSFVGVTYSRQSGKLVFTLGNGSKITLDIPIDGLIDEITYDSINKELLVYELSGNVKHIDIKELFIRYLGSVNPQITIDIVGTNLTGNQVIQATINAKSITADLMDDESVTNRILKDGSVTNNKIASNTIITENIQDKAITYEKLASDAIHGINIADRTIQLSKLVTAGSNDRILGVLTADSSPVWTKLTSGMIGNGVILNDHILNNQITGNKIADQSIQSDKIADGAILNEKLGNYSITDEKIVDNTISGSKLKPNTILAGTPSIQMRPPSNSDNDQIPDTAWVLERMNTYQFHANNFADRSVTGRALFSSGIVPRALVVKIPNGDPIWGLIEHEMLDENSVRTINIADQSVTSSKLDILSVNASHITYHAVENKHISEGAVTGIEIEPSNIGSRVLGVLVDGAHPEYTKVLRDMIQKGAIYGDHIENQSLTLDKFKSSTESNRALITLIKNTDPVWGQIRSEIIADRAVKGNNLFSSKFHNKVLLVDVAGNDPTWGSIIGPMIADHIIQENHIDYGAIGPNQIKDKAVESQHILDGNIETIHIASQAVTGNKLFTSSLPDRVLAVIGNPYSEPVYTTVNTNMIDDEAITGDKLFRSMYPYRVIATTQAGRPPEYIKITGDFIVDDSINAQKLKYNLTLLGTPELTLPPLDTADNYQLANTKWVRETVHGMIAEYNSGLIAETILTSMIADKAITGDKLFTSQDGPRILGITAPGAVPEYLLIEDFFIVDGAVTSNKLQHNITLFGQPILEIRPPAYASDNDGGGNLIPDCQWVKSTIESYNSWSGGSTPLPPGGGGSLGPNTIGTDMIINRAVNGAKLFTSSVANSVLAVLGQNTDPQYTKINTEMISSRAVTATKIFSTPNANTALIVKSANGNPEWSKIDINCLSIDNAIDTIHINNQAITGDKIQNNTIRAEKFAQEPLITQPMIFDNAVGNSKVENNAISTSKIADNAVTSHKISDNAVTSAKIDSDVVLKGHPTVQLHTDYSTRSLRNTIISPNAPTNDQGENGDIWFQYA